MSPDAALRIAAITGFLAVACGAIGAHGLESALRKSAIEPAQLAKQLAWWNTAAQYHLIHAVALLALATRPAVPRVSFVLFLAGLLAFSGTLYFMAATGSTALRHVTPLGGFLLLGGWLALLGNRSNRA